VRAVAAALGSEGGLNAANLRVAESCVAAFARIAKAGNTLIIPSNLSDPAAMVASAMTVLARMRGQSGQTP
jgi:hypothetical protein